MKSRIPILFAISMLIMPVIPVFSKSNAETVDSVSQVLRAMVVEDAIAESSGYVRRATYYTHFNKVFGISPAQYRKVKEKLKN